MNCPMEELVRLWQSEELKGDAWEDWCRENEVTFVDVWKARKIATAPQQELFT